MSKLSETLTAWNVNYDHKVPKAYHDTKFMQQLNNDLSTLVMNISIMEVEFCTSAAAKAQARKHVQAK